MNDEVMELEQPEDFDDTVYDDIMEEAAERRRKIIKYLMIGGIALCAVLGMMLVFLGVVVFWVFFAV